ALHPELPGPEDRIVYFPEGKVDVFQQEAMEKYPAMLYPALRFPKKLEQSLLLGGRKGVPDYCGLAYVCSEGRDIDREYVFPRGYDNTEHTPYPHRETTRGTTLLSRVQPQILPGRRDLFSLIRAPNPTKVKTKSRPCAGHEVPLLTVTANRVIKMEDPATATDSSGVPSTIERSPLDFAYKNPSQLSTGPEDQEATVPKVPPPENVATTGVALEAAPAKRVAATSPVVVKERRKRGHDGVDTNAPPKVLRRDHADPRLTESTHEGKSLAAIELGMGSTCPVPASQGAHVDVSDPDPLSFACPQSRPSADVTYFLLTYPFVLVTQIFQGGCWARDPDSENTSFASMVGSPESIYRPEWGITNDSMLDAPEACQDLVDHIAPPGYFLEFMNYLEEQTDGETMINSIQNGDQPLPVIAQVSLVGNAQNAPPTIKDLNNETAKDLWDALERQMRGSEYGEQDRKATILKTKNQMDINIDALYNNLKQNQGDVNDALGYKKKVVTSDPLALVAEKTNVSKRKEKVVVLQILKEVVQMISGN
nr:hypothetical protein [Tanacetum cinerariifolium]